MRSEIKGRFKSAPPTWKPQFSTPLRHSTSLYPASSACSGDWTHWLIFIVWFPWGSLSKLWKHHSFSSVCIFVSFRTSFSHSFFFFHKQSTCLFKPAQHIVLLSFCFRSFISLHFLSFSLDAGCNSAYNWDSICADLGTHKYTHFLSSCSPGNTTLRPVRSTY